MKVRPRAEWLALFRRTGARVFKRAADHQPAAVPMGRPEVLCSRELRSKRNPQVLRLEPGVALSRVPGLPPARGVHGSAIQDTSNSAHTASPAAGLWRAQSAVEPHRYAAAAIVAPAHFFKAVKRGAR